MKTKCLQISLDATSWTYNMLAGMFERNGSPVSGEECREELLKMKSVGFVVIPCGIHKCDANGRCSGEVK